MTPQTAARPSTSTARADSHSARGPRNEGRARTASEAPRPSDLRTGSTQRHGTVAGYREDGCRCAPCTTAATRNVKVYKLRRIANGGRPLSVDAIGAQRRIRALMAIGYPRKEISRMLGSEGDVACQILGVRKRVFLPTHDAVADLYERLCMTPGPSGSSRKRAASKGWYPPMAWVDIDDPDENPSEEAPDDFVDPVVIERILAGDKVPATRLEREEVVACWRAAGRPLAELERVTGWKVDRYYTPDGRAA